MIPLGTGNLAAGQSGGVIMRFDRPIAMFAGQRFVMRRPGVHGQSTAAGGEVLDPEPPQVKGSVSLAASLLEQLRGPIKDRLLHGCSAKLVATNLLPSILPLIFALRAVIQRPDGAWASPCASMPQPTTR